VQSNGQADANDAVVDQLTGYGDLKVLWMAAKKSNGLGVEGEASRVAASVSDRQRSKSNEVR
jgi:hypothetical protein